MTKNIDIDIDHWVYIETTVKFISLTVIALIIAGWET